MCQILKLQKIRKQVSFLNFISAIDLADDLRNLEIDIEKSVSEDKFIQEICTPLLRGGKRLRPILFLLCARAKNIYSPEKNLPLATALELIHTASLVHDDILDSAKKRRGVETINSKYNSKIAVLVGDYLFAKAFQLVAENNYGNEVSLILSNLIKNLCVGEISQDRNLFAVPTLSEYYNRINLKTAFFLSTCCRLGGVVAKLEKSDVENLANYGTSLGLAFQIVDDLLDFFGEENITGKALGGDLKSGVITLPVIRALQSEKISDTLKKIIAQDKISDAEVLTAIKIIRETDAIEYCKNRAASHINCARFDLPNDIEESVRNSLEKIADFVINRKW